MNTSLRAWAMIGCLLFGFALFGQQDDAYHIQFKVDNYDGKLLTVANNMLKQQYVVDTLRLGNDGKFHLRDTAALPKGIYLGVLAPDNLYFQFMVGNEAPFFELQVDRKDLANVKSKGSKENQIFFDYLTFMDLRKREDGTLRDSLKVSILDPAVKSRIEQRRELLNKEVTGYQQRVIEEDGESFGAAVIKANQPVTPPDYPELETEARRYKQWRYLQNHYFDQLNLNDERLLRTPFLFDRIDYFVQKLHVQHPDSISVAIDKVLRRMDPASDMFRVYLSHFLNEAAGSKIVGRDAIYVHLIDNYYAKNQAPWTDDDLLRKFKENADRLRPILIGKTAPDIQMQKQDGSSISLHEVDSEFTVLYFWRYDCGHCKESMPVMKEFYEKWKNKGVTLFAVCAKMGKEVPPCWEFIDEQGIGDWLHTVDPFMRSRYVKLYDVQQTPALFVLDKDKKIISKRIGAEQLDELLMRITDQETIEKSGR